MSKLSKPPSQRKRHLLFENLEKRDVPATWGIAWPEAQHLTASFVPDGTLVDGQSSQLFKKLDTQFGAGKWQPTILNALQTWAANSNINIGQVADGGQAAGSPGAPQGAPNFGDIRISAVPLPADVAAITAPYDPSTGTISGDMIFNSNDDFSSQTGLDLFTVALHESGHVFGFADSSDPNSFMYNVYQGPQTSLSQSAINALQNLYGGPRNLTAQSPGTLSIDQTQPIDLSTSVYGSNGSFSGAYYASGASLTGDLSSTVPANYFQIQVPLYSQAPLGVDIQIQTAGVSQLLPQITVTNSAGAIVIQSSAVSGSSGMVSVHINPSYQGGILKIQVSSPATDIHAVGSYVLSASTTKYADSINPNNNKATQLNAKSLVASVPLIATNPISSTNQQDLYSFITPSQKVSSLTIQLQANGIALNAPQLDVYNSFGNKVGTATATNLQSPIVNISISNPSANSTYYVKATAGTVNAYQFGIYQLAVSFGTTATTSQTMSVLSTPWLGSLTSSASSTPNTSLKNATQFTTPPGYAPGSYYVGIAGLADPSTSQYYSVKAPSSNKANSMLVSIQAISGFKFFPWVTVSDSMGNALPSKVFTNSSGVLVMQVTYTGSPTLIIKVASSAANGGGSTGNYYLSTTFATAVPSNDLLSSGSVDTSSTSIAATVIPSSTELHQFVLMGDATNAATDAILRVTITDSKGKVVATLTSVANEAASLNLMLTDSRYSIYVDAYSPSGSTVSGLKFSLTGANLTDPIRTYAPPAGGTSPTSA